MGLLDFILLGFSLSMDAFAISLVKGLVMPRMQWAHASVIGLFFGGFQFLMPVAGWLLGSQFAAVIGSFSDLVAFALLAFIGGKMLWETKGDEAEDDKLKNAKLDIPELFLLAIATSIDALAVGITFAFLDINVLEASFVIGLVTFLICVAGVVIGHLFGTRFQKGAQVLGGLVLVLMGVRFLLSHFGIHLL